jgi:site-specific DNA recombinase
MRCVMPPRPGSSNGCGALSPDRLARAYAYQVLVLDELDRFGITVAFTDSPGLAADDPQSVLLTQVQGVIAEYEKAKIAAGHPSQS